MAKTVGKLTALKVQRETKPGLHSDGSGLYLQVTGAGAKSWVFRFTLAGKAREMGLGSFSAIGLAEAREKAAECRRLRSDGVDPIEARNSARTAELAAAAKIITFNTAAELFIDSQRAGWRNEKHIQQWTNTLATYAGPVLGSLPVQMIDTALVLKVLQPIWTAKPETASRVRGRVESVLDWATAQNRRTGENPARWRGHLDKLLPTKTKVRSVVHHAAMPFDDVPAFIEALRASDGVSARGLEFVILTAARSGEVRGARWEEFDFRAGTWTVPASRMKARREHKVPLCSRAMAILNEMRQAGGDPFIFPGARSGKPLSVMAFDMTLRRLKVDVTTHGFRSSFRDWAAERSSFPSEVVEMALAHTIGSKVEAAYRRGDLFDKRCKLMEAWAKFCEGRPSAAILPIGAIRQRVQS